MTTPIACETRPTWEDLWVSIRAWRNQTLREIAEYDRLQARDDALAAISDMSEGW